MNLTLDDEPPHAGTWELIRERCREVWGVDCPFPWCKCEEHPRRDATTNTGEERVAG